jgi:hypothetical protein
MCVWLDDLTGYMSNYDFMIGKLGLGLHMWMWLMRTKNQMIIKKTISKCEREVTSCVFRSMYEN